jgi:Na+/pantothenate symporter
MIELGVVGFLVLIFVISIYVLRKSTGNQELVKEYEH